MEQLEDVAGITHVHLTLADVARLRGDEVRATALYSQALEEVFAIGDRRCIASTHRNLGVMANARNEHARAVELFLQALVMRHELGDEAGLAECLEGLAAAAAAMGSHQHAATVLAAAETRRDTSGASPHPEDDPEIRSLVESLREAMSSDDFERAWDDGRRLAPDAVVLFCAEAFVTVPASH